MTNIIKREQIDEMSERERENQEPKQSQTHKKTHRKLNVCEYMWSVFVEYI